jgi:regulator of PEP synthase PpsR (kinase-PPPase family)
MNETHKPTDLSERWKRSIALYIMSGGVGSSGEHLARTVMAQFPDANITVEIYPKVFTKKQVQQILRNAAEVGAIVTHTFVDPKLRRTVEKTSQQLKLVAIDLVGPLMENMSEKMSQEPLGKPGLYRQLYRSDLDRIDAMHYALNHDDGRNFQGWVEAEIVLLGASRVGKTPICLYLSVLGWKVANVPLVAGISPRDELFEMDKRRVIGLTIAPSELIDHRKHRQSTLGVVRVNSDYINPQKVYEEIDEIEKFLRRNGISTIDVTGKPIETSADEIVRLVRRKLKRKGG